MNTKESKTMKAGLIKLLKSKGTYEKATDDGLIDDIVFNMYLIAKADIQTRGAMVDIGKDKPFYQINFSISIFHNSVKSINSILKQLGLVKAVVENNDEDRAFQDLNNKLKGS